MVKKITIKIILCNQQKNNWVHGLRQKKDDVEGPGTVNICVAQTLFKQFLKGETSFEDKLIEGRPILVADDALLEMYEQPNTTPIFVRTRLFKKHH